MSEAPFCFSGPQIRLAGGIFQKLVVVLWSSPWKKYELNLEF